MAVHCHIVAQVALIGTALDGPSRIHEPGEHARCPVRCLSRISVLVLLLRERLLYDAHSDSPPEFTLHFCRKIATVHVAANGLYRMVRLIYVCYIRLVH